MRTTLTIDDDVLREARSLAEKQGSSLGKALSALARRGLKEPHPKGMPRSFPTFDVPPDAPVITMERVKKAESEG